MSNEGLSAPPTANAEPFLERPPVVVAILLLCVFFIAGMRWRTYDEPVRGDYAVYAVIGHELLNGRQLYADLWDHKPPGIHLVYALAELIAGYGPQQIYLLNLAALTVTLLGLYRAGILLGGTRAGLGAALFWALSSVFPHWQGYQPNTEAFVNALLVWSYCLLFRLGITPIWSRACAFGALVGMASLFKQVAVAPVGLLAIVYVLGAARNQGGRWLAAGHILVAAAVSMALWVGCAAWFWSQGTFAEFYDAVFVYNRYHAGDLAANLAGSLHHSHRSYLLLVVIPCLLAPFMFPWLGPGQRNGWFLLAGWAAGCHIAASMVRIWPEYFFELWMPVYALAAGALVAGLWAAHSEKPCVCRWALLALVFGPLAARMVQRNQYDSAPWEVFKVGSPEYCFRHEPRDVGLAINRLLLPGERLYALGVPGESAPLYFYARQSPPSGVFFDFPLRAGRPLAGKLEDRLVRDLGKDPPDLIVLSKLSGLMDPGEKQARWGQRLAAWIAQRYTQRHFDGPDRYTYYVRRRSALEGRLAHPNGVNPLMNN